MSDLPLKDLPAPDDATEGEPAPRRKRKPIGWSFITIGVLVVVSAALVWRRDGIQGVTEILTHDVTLFGGILPRVLAGCLLGAFIAEILPHDKVSRSLGPDSGLKRPPDRHGLRRDPARWSVHRLSGGERAAHRRCRFRRHHRDGR